MPPYFLQINRRELNWGRFPIVTGRIGNKVKGKERSAMGGNSH